MTSIFTFASPWALSPHGRDELLQAFKDSEGGLESKFLPETSNAEFVSLRCTEQCFLNFVNFTSKFYDRELSQKFDVFEEPKLIRISGTSAAGALHSETHFVPPLQLSSHGVEQAQLIQHEKCTSRWTPTRRNDQDNIAWHVLPAIRGRIERLTHVRLTPSTTDLTIIGDTETAIAQATRKLNNLEEASVLHILNHNFLVFEGETYFQLCLLPLKEILDSRLRTTLLSPQSPYYKSLPSSHILVVVKNGEIRKIELTVEVVESSHLWDGHQLSLHLSKGRAQYTTKPTPISKWVDESNAAQVVDPFTPHANNESAPEDVPRFVDPMSSSLEKVSTKRTRKVKGATGKSKASDPPSHPGHDELHMLRQEPETEALSFKEGPYSSLSDTPSFEEQKFSQLPTQLQIAPSSNIHPPIIQPPFIPPPSFGAPKSWEPDHHNWENHVAPIGHRVGTLIDLDSPAVSSKQTTFSKDKMHRTMGQKKPQSMASNHQLTKALGERVHEMLCSVLARPNIKISVLIGRILVDRHTIPSEYRKKPFSVKEWPHAIGHLRTHFTERLTTNSSDISHLIGLKLQHSRRLFKETPSKRRVTYVFECLTRSAEQITIEIDEEGASAVRGAAIINGALNWHFAKRAWDACLRVTSHEFIGGEYTQEIQAFAKSLKISADNNGLNISFCIQSSNFHVKSMILRREIIHDSTTFPDLQLHATEVQILDVNQSTENVADFTGILAPQDEMIASHQLWWEVSASSQHADNILKESEALELGEKAEWKPGAILKHGMVEDMYGLAQEIVTRIDHVGMGNKGPGTSGSKETTKPSAKSYELPTGVPGFW